MTSSLIGILFVFGCQQQSTESIFKPQNEPSYFGQSVQETKIEFNSFLYVSKSVKVVNEKTIATNLNTVYKYMLGKIHETGSIAGKYNFTLQKVESVNDELYRVYYNFKGKGVFPKGLKTLNLHTVYFPNSLYKMSNNLCHKPDADVDAGNFWYDWNETLEGCPLKLNYHFGIVTAQLNPITETVRTFPEYDRLIVNNEVNISTFFGYADYSIRERQPIATKSGKIDLGTKQFLDFRDFLVNQMGMSVREWSENELRQVFNPKNIENLPYVLEFTKVTAKGLIRIKSVYAQTGLYHNSRGFHVFYQRALKNDAVVLYDGHSGIGKNINLNLIEESLGYKVTFNPNYQIVFMGSCLPYAYYTDMYFGRKVNTSDVNGTKNLDILAYAKEAHFGNGDNKTIVYAIDRYMTNTKKMSYQEIIGLKPLDFFGVIGDEDNPNN